MGITSEWKITEELHKGKIKFFLYTWDNDMWWCKSCENSYEEALAKMEQLKDYPKDKKLQEWYF